MYDAGNREDAVMLGTSRLEKNPAAENKRVERHEHFKDTIAA